MVSTQGYVISICSLALDILCMGEDVCLWRPSLGHHIKMVHQCQIKLFNGKDTRIEIPHREMMRASIYSSVIHDLFCKLLTQYIL